MSSAGGHGRRLAGDVTARAREGWAAAMAKDGRDARTTRPEDPRQEPTRAVGRTLRHRCPRPPSRRVRRDRITGLDPETTVAWEGDRACGTVALEPSGWGTKVTITAKLAEEVVAEPVAVERARRREPEPEPVAVEPEPKPEPERVGPRGRTTAEAPKAACSPACSGAGAGGGRGGGRARADRAVEPRAQAGRGGARAGRGPAGARAEPMAVEPRSSRGPRPSSSTSSAPEAILTGVLDSLG